MFCPRLGDSFTKTAQVSAILDGILRDRIYVFNCKYFRLSNNIITLRRGGKGSHQVRHEKGKYCEPILAQAHMSTCYIGIRLGASSSY